MSTSDPQEIRADIERTRGELSRDVDTLGDRVNPSQVARRRMDRARSGMARVRDRVMGTAHDTMDSTQGTMHDMADRSREAASSVADSARHTASSVAETAGSAPRRMREQTQGNPLAAGLVAFGLGLVIASLVPSSRTEQRAAKAVEEKAEPLVEGVRSTASEVAHDLEQPARESVDAVRDAAKDAARSVGEHGRAAADDIRSRATGSE
jgi:type VI protein secretion system component VasK